MMKSFLVAAFVAGLLMIAPDAAAQLEDPFVQDWPVPCLGLADPFCTGDEMAKKDCSKIIVNTKEKCYEKCRCTHTNDVTDCKRLSGPAATACQQTADRAKDQCIVMCGIDYNGMWLAPSPENGSGQTQ